MRSTVAMFAAAAILLAGASAAFAEGTAHEFSGQIRQVDTAAKTMAVKGGGKNPTEMTFAIASDAKIVAGSKAKSLGELRVGERVRVSYANVGSKHEAQRIEVMPAKTAMAKPHPKPSAK